MSDRTCIVAECESPVRANGYCRMHNHRLATVGTLDMTGACVICTVSIPYPGRGPRRKLCGAESCRLGYNVVKTTEYRKRNPDGVRTTGRRWREANPIAHESQRRAAHLRRVYGMSVDDYRVMLTAQGGGCAICGGVGKRKWLAVDHCHESGIVRGLLCDTCNLMLGLAKDNPGLLTKAINYIANSAVLSEDQAAAVKYLATPIS